MKQILTILIQDDIHFTRLVNTLMNLDIDLTAFLRDNGRVIFMLLNIEEEDKRNEPFVNAYLDKIVDAAEKERIEESTQAESIVEWLMVIGENTMIEYPHLNQPKAS